MEKLLVFINPVKFKDLVNNHEFLSGIGFTKTDEVYKTTTYLSNDTMVSISDDKCSIIAITEINGFQGGIFLIPDSKIQKLFGTDNSLILNTEFKILYHGQTKNEYGQYIDKLINKSKGSEKTNEVLGSKYHELAQLIQKPSIHSIDGFISKISTFDSILESKLNLLHLCLTPSGATLAKSAEDYSLIKQEVEKLKISEEKSIIDYLGEQEIDDCLDEEKYLKYLATLRDALLPS